MKILHTSDWHLGRSFHQASLASAFDMWCAHVVELVKERSIDAVLISGDVYDRAVPAVPWVRLLSATLEKLAEHTRVILTSGNHDSASRLGFGASFMEKITICTDPLRSHIPVSIESTAGKECALIYPLPYLNPDVCRLLFSPDYSPGTQLAPESLLPRTHEAVMRAALDRIYDDIEARVNREQAAHTHVIVMAHAFVTGGKASDSENSIAVGGVENVPAEIFTRPLKSWGRCPVSYVALGHLHSPQTLSLPSQSANTNQPILRYSGSPIAFSFSETRPKSSTLITLDGQSLTYEEIPAPLWRAARTLEGSYTEVTQMGPSEDFLRILLSDTNVSSQQRAHLFDIFPHLVELHYAHAAHAALAERSHLEPLELISLFVRNARGSNLEKAESEYIEKIWAELHEES